MKQEDFLSHLKVSKILKQAVDFLRQRGIENPQLDARVLLEFVLNYSTEQLLRRLESELTFSQLEQYRALLERRGNREPVALITEQKEFWGRDFKVSKDTLIPRPDSETLIAAVMQLIPDTNLPLNILELGVGSGCLAVTLLAEYPNANLVGIDIHFPALQVARENAIKHGVDDRLILINTSWMSAIRFKFNLVVTNPPYVSELDRDKLQPELSFEPSLALFAGIDGMDCYHEISEALPSVLDKGGVFIGECGHDQADTLVELLAQKGLKQQQKFYDLAGIARCVAAIR